VEPYDAERHLRPSTEPKLQKLRCALRGQPGRLQRMLHRLLPAKARRASKRSGMVANVASIIGSSSNLIGRTAASPSVVPYLAQRLDLFAHSCRHTMHHQAPACPERGKIDGGHVDQKPNRGTRACMLRSKVLAHRKNCRPAGKRFAQDAGEEARRGRIGRIRPDADVGKAVC
jgi:hypothetical protein